MYDSTVTERPHGLEMRWVPVTDERGRTRMEAVWIDTGSPSPTAAHHAA